VICLLGNNKYIRKLKLFPIGLPIKDFTIKASANNATRVIAQEILSTYPDLVHIDYDGYYMVNEISSWKLIKAIQELKEENEALKLRIEALEQNHRFRSKCRLPSIPTKLVPNFVRVCEHHSNKQLPSGRGRSSREGIALCIFQLDASRC